MSGLFSKETRRQIAIQPGEARIVLWSAAYFFFVLASFSILRPVREQFGVSAGLNKLPLLFLGTWVAMLLLNPLYGAAVSRLPRDRFIPLVYRFFMLLLVGFFVGLVVSDADQRVWLGRGFYIFVSVFNLWVVSVFWSFMADNFGSTSARRLYAWIAVGGTIGSIFGAVVTLTIVEVWGGAQGAGVVPYLLLVSVFVLEAAVWCNRRVTRLFQAHPELATAPRTDASARIGGRAIDGLKQVARSPYLLKICLYLFCYTITGTLLYFMQAAVVAGHFETRADRTQAFALIDLATQTTTLFVQVFLTRRLIAAMGIGRTLAVLPVVAALAFISVAVWPLFLVLVVAQGLRRSANYAISKPAREVLYSVVERSEKYKAKAFVDTFVYRTGDVIGSGLRIATGLIGPGLGLVAAVAVPISVAWALLSGSLGRAYRERARTFEGTPP